MVRKGEYLERAVAIPGERATLEGLFHRGTRLPPLLIAPPHPAAGSMESPIIAELAWAVTRAGHATLRFNYRGVGASAGTFDGGESALRDVWFASDHLRGTVASPALLGVGYGAELVARHASLEAREHGIAPPLVVLVSPETEHLPVAELAELESELVFICAEKEGPSRRGELSQLAARTKNGRVAVIPQADRAFLRGLVDLGRVVAEAIAPPGMLDLGEG